MYLLFPQWQGAGERPGLYEGAHTLASQRSDLDWQAVEVSDRQLARTERGVRGYAQLLAQLEQATTLLRAHQPRRIFTLGGDCSVELAPVSYLNARYERLVVVWLDAHADLQTPETSPSGDLHGMPLRLLLGEGEASLKGQPPSFLTPDQVVLAGVRALDPAEAAVVRARGIRTLSATEINDHSGSVVEAARELGPTHIYLHVDLDVLDPGAFSSLGWPEPDGVSVAALETALRALHRKFDVVGGGLTEYLPADQSDEAAAERVLSAWLSR